MIGGGAPSRGVLHAGTRGSRLAVWQAELVLGLLEERWPAHTFRRREYSTHGDERRESPLAEIGGRGAFTEVLEAALLSGEVAFAVHSLKDLPVRSAPGLVIGAVVGPRNSGEALVSRNGAGLSELPRGAVVGTSSLRRQAQLLFRRPDLEIRPIRGNVETRIEKVVRGDYDATILATAGLERLGLLGRASEELSAKIILPAPGQGAIAVECREDDEELLQLLAAIDDALLHDCTRAERSFLGTLGAGCSAPVGALAVDTMTPAGERGYRMVGRVIAPDGSRMIEVEDRDADPAELGRRLAEEALRRGADAMLGGMPRAGSEAVLDGKRVVVTRPRSQAASLAEQLEAEGAEVVLVPVIETRPLIEGSRTPAALKRLSEYRWIVLTSSNAATYFLDLVRRTGGEVASLGERIAVVGGSTAAAMSASGVAPAFIGRGQTGADLARELPDAEGCEVLLPCAVHHGEALPRLLRERGARVTPLPLYRTELLPIEARALEELRKGVDYLLFTSGSTVRGFFEGLRGAGGEELVKRTTGRAKIACIGPSTAAVVEEAGFRADIVAKEHSAAGLIAALLEAARESVR